MVEPETTVLIGTRSLAISVVKMHVMGGFTTDGQSFGLPSGSVITVPCLYYHANLN